MSQRQTGQVIYSNHLGIVENEIVRIAHRVALGQGMADIRALYASEGKPIGDASLAYCAAKTYLKIDAISNREFQLQRQNSTPTRREIPAVRLPLPHIL